MRPQQLLIPCYVAAVTALAGLAGGNAMQDEEGPAVVNIAPYRYDDLLWENDLVAYRIYGAPLEAAEPPSGSGIDAWGKNTDIPFMVRMLQGSDYHADSGEGLDFYSVGTSRGAGGLGIWHDNKLWVSRNYRDPEIIASGADTAHFRVHYEPWPVGTERQVSETRDIFLPAGSRYTRMTAVLDATGDGPLTVAIGIARKPAGSGEAVLSVDEEAGILSAWGPETDHGAMAIAVHADPDRVSGFTQDSENFLMLLEIEPGTPFSWCMASGWSGTGDFPDRAAWDAFAFQPAPDHCATPDHFLTVE